MSESRSALGHWLDWPHRPVDKGRLVRAIAYLRRPRWDEATPRDGKLYPSKITRSWQSRSRHNHALEGEEIDYYFDRSRNETTFLGRAAEFPKNEPERGRRAIRNNSSGDWSTRANCEVLRRTRFARISGFRHNRRVLRYPRCTRLA